VDGSLERRVLSSADRVAIVSPACADHLTTRFPRVYDVIMNGFDEGEFERVDVHTSAPFTIAHMGSMDASRNPVALWKALSAPEFADAGFGVKLIGRVDPVVSESVGQHGLASFVEIMDQLDHSDVTARMSHSSILLVVINRTPLATGIVPGKTYEYIGSGRPVLGIGPIDGDAARVLSDSGAGDMFDYEDVDGIARYVKRHMRAWSQGTPLAGADVARARPFTRRSRTQKLAEILDDMCSPRN
jgi:hypothetical protein